MYRVKYNDRYGSTGIDETFWTEEGRAKQEFAAAKDHIKGAKNLAEVELHELNVDSQDVDHRLVEKFNGFDESPTFKVAILC